MAFGASLRGEALVAASAIGFGAMPYFALDAYAAGLSVPTLLALRFGIAAAVVFAYLGLTGRLRRPTRRLLVVGSVLGVGYAGMSSMYFNSVRFVPPSVTSLLLYTYPALVAVVSGLLARRAPARGVLAALGLSALGIVLAIGPGQVNLGPQAWLGIAFGLAAPLIYTGYIVVGGRFAGGLSPLVLTGWVSLSAAAVLGVLGAASGELQVPPPVAGWVPALLVALVSTVGAVGCFLAGVQIIGATRASIISTIEPVVTLLIGVVAFAYPLTAWQLVGTMLVLAGASVATLTRAAARTRRRRAEASP